MDRTDKVAKLLSSARNAADAQRETGRTDPRDFVQGFLEWHAHASQCPLPWQGAYLPAETIDALAEAFRLMRFPEDRP